MYPPRPPSENEYVVDSTRGKDEGQIEARDDWEKAYSSDDDDDCDRSRSGHLINFNVSHHKSLTPHWKEYCSLSILSTTFRLSVESLKGFLR